MIHETILQIKNRIQIKPIRTAGGFFILARRKHEGIVLRSFYRQIGCKRAAKRPDSAAKGKFGQRREYAGQLHGSQRGKAQPKNHVSPAGQRAFEHDDIAPQNGIGENKHLDLVF